MNNYEIITILKELEINLELFNNDTTETPLDMKVQEENTARWMCDISLLTKVA